MTIPFVDLFKKVTEKVTARFLASAAPGPARVESVRVKKPSGERLSKTVLPNTTRSLTPSDPFRVSAGPGASRSRDLPPALAFALEPKVERAISLQLADFLDQVPADYIKPVEVIDTTRCVALKASEIEKGMPDHKPSISLASLYQQLPEIFLRSVPLTDPTRISLPYAKVLEQFNNTRVRADQVRDQRVPQRDTPILKATLEDTERFGKKIEPLKTSPPHPVISLHATDLQSAPEKDSPPASAKIPFHLPPNGTGAPASERVPASSGPPVPITLPAPPEAARILFNPPAEIVDPKIRSATARNESAPDVAATLEVIEADKPTMGLALKPLLQNVPSFQLNGDATAVAEDVRVEFPRQLIEPQLAGGRVVVSAKMFQQAIPEMHRQLFVVDPEETPVSLPLQEVLKNLPAAALKMRDDQEKALTGKDFETPFAIKAKEDAERFRVAPAPAPEVSKKSASERPTEAKIDSTPKEKIDGKQVLARACKLPGVQACEIMFLDGLRLAGNFPPEISADGLCAMAPTSLQRIDTHMRESKLGALTAMTLHSTSLAITFFMKESICLAALHSDSAALAPDTRAQLGELVEELSRTYAHPETPHVDH